MLATHGMHFLSDFNQDSFVSDINAFSQRGRRWVRTIGNVKMPRTCLVQLEDLVDIHEGAYLLDCLLYTSDAADE
ncbi:MAG: hypothetical protein KUG78_21330, partial [Kangiellaceae bacterium]|nr:hypothetical protein [Kangiellaceae bacterium]